MKRRIIFFCAIACAATMWLAIAFAAFDYLTTEKWIEDDQGIHTPPIEQQLNELKADRSVPGNE